MDDTQAPAQGETMTFGETIAPASFIGLSLKNALLNIVTLTLYRFWAKTEVRKRLGSKITLIGSAIFLAFRYMASRTNRRGVRFQLKGSPAKYGWSYLGYSLLTGITLGWFVPAMSLTPRPGAPCRAARPARFIAASTARPGGWSAP